MVPHWTQQHLDTPKLIAAKPCCHGHPFEESCCHGHWFEEPCCHGHMFEEPCCHGQLFKEPCCHGHLFEERCCHGHLFGDLRSSNSTTNRPLQFIRHYWISIFSLCQMIASSFITFQLNKVCAKQVHRQRSARAKKLTNKPPHGGLPCGDTQAQIKFALTIYILGNISTSRMSESSVPTYVGLHQAVS